MAFDYDDDDDGGDHRDLEKACVEDDCGVDYCKRWEKDYNQDIENLGMEIVGKGRKEIEGIVDLQALNYNYCRLSIQCYYLVILHSHDGDCYCQSVVANNSLHLQ